MKKTLFLAILGASAMSASAITIDGTITAGEWAGAAQYTIGNGGGTASFRADANYIYGAFDITGWTEPNLASTTHGFLLGFGVWGANQSYPNPPGVEFQQANIANAWGNDGNSGTMNGLVSAFRIDAQSPPAASIPGDLQAMDSFATGHRVWEVKMPISTMGVTAGDIIWTNGGINYKGQAHWYPDTYMVPVAYKGSYAPITVEAGSVPDGGTTLVLLGGALTGLGALRRKFRA